MSETYEDLLKSGWNELPDPKVLPEGSWLLKKTRGSYFKEDEDRGLSARVSFEFKPVEPMDDVDAEEIDKLGPDYDIGENRVEYTIFVERSADWKRKVLPFLAKLGVGVDPNEDPRETVKKRGNGNTIIAYLGTRTFTTRDGEVVEQNTAKQFRAVA